MHFARSFVNDFNEELQNDKVPKHFEFQTDF